jgi:uncharacterized protein (DUF427 family)
MRPALEDLELGPTATPSLGQGFRWEDTRRRVRAVFNDVAVADSRGAKLLQEFGRLPVFYFPLDDVRHNVLQVTDYVTQSSLKGDATYWTIKVGDRTAENAAWTYREPLPGGPPIKGYAAFYWNKMDAWYEEDQQVFGHARDPYKRVDILPTSRRVQVVLGGETIADTQHPRLLLETGIITRYYIPRQDVRMELLEPTDVVSHCPYKGRASYWTARIGEQEYRDVVWSYRTPLPECNAIAEYLCFYNERVDAILDDGEQTAAPKTIWSE